MFRTNHQRIATPFIQILLLVFVTHNAYAADDWITIYNNILNNSGNTSGISCMDCHTANSADIAGGASGAGLCSANRNFANYDDISLSGSFGAGYLGDGSGADSFMPQNPVDCSSPTTNELSDPNVQDMLDWVTAGKPKQAPTVFTRNNAFPITKTGATLKGDFNTNVYSATTVAGTYYFDYGLTNSYGSTSSSVNYSATAVAFRSIAISGLQCGKTYHYRARATNGAYTGGSAAAGVDRTFSTLACTDPVIAGVTIVADATSQVATEDANKNMTVTVIDNDPGVLNWSKTNGINGGTVTLVSDTSTELTGSATVRYRSPSNYFGADSFTVTVTNATTFKTHVVTFNMTVSDDGSDSPVITATSPFALNEDNSASADTATSAANVTISAFDPDNAPSYFWDVTVENDGNANFSPPATGSSPTLTYTPLQDDFGAATDSFTVRVCDAGVGLGNCDTQVFSVNLTARPDSPDATLDTGLVVVENAASTLLSVVGNDTDTDFGETATLVPDNVMVTGGAGLTVNGIVGNQIDVAHDGAEEVSAQLTYRAKDTTNRTSNTVTVNIIISGTDDLPTGNDFTFGSTVNEGSSANEINVIAQSDDPEKATMAVCAGTLSTPTYGTVSVNGSGNVEYNHDGTNVVVASTDSDSFTYQVNDANDPTCASGNNSAAKTVSINLAAVNDRPVAIADSFTVAEGGTFSSAVDGLDQGPSNSSVLDNDTDEENGTGTGFTVNGNSIPGFNAGFNLTNATGEFTYTHNGSENFSTSFTYTVNDVATDSASPGIVSITVIPVNDAPAIDLPLPTTANVFTEEVPIAIHTVTASDADDSVFSYSLGATGLAGDTPAGNMVIGLNSGVIIWTPPRTGNFNQATAIVTVTATDASSTEGGNNKQDVQMFQIATSPLDADGDTVPDYDDNCPAISNVGQSDMDGDTVRLAVDPSGIPAAGDVDPAARDAANVLAESYLKGGDACDEDADGDGMSNTFENSFAFLDPLDASDATADEDGDGVSNIDEFLASSAPDVDSVAPVVNAPPDITIDATGLLTAVDLGTATGSDGNDGDVTIFKAVVGISTTDLARLDDPVTGCTAFSNYKTDIKPFRPGSYVVTWATCDSAGNSARDSQIVNVKPLVSVNSGQSVGEGQAVSVNVVLNGNAISYPATVEYTITGTATAVDDHDAVAGTVSFASPGDVGVINFNTVADGATVGDASESDETVVITLHTPSKIALNNTNVHTVIITEANVAPQVALRVSQPAAALDKKKGNTLYTADGAAKIVASASDGNGDALSFDWSATDNTLLGLASITREQIDIDPNLLTTGSFYKVVVTVSDGVTPVTVERLLLVKAGEINVLSAGADDDGDGKLNENEGYGDDDADGIPNYIDSNSTPPSAIENQTVNLKTSVYIETDPGLKIAMGETAIAAQTSGVLISMQDIIDHGGAGGIAVVNAATDYVFFSGLLNFEISGLTDDTPSANVVIPLSSAIQADAVYRKYNNSGWFDFVEDDLNALGSAAGNDGTCPQPGSNLYTAGLTPGHLCLQLTIQDGGANDTDGVRNFVIRDPGGLALEPESDVVAAPSDASGRVGSVGLWFMLILSITAVAVWRLRVRAAANTAG